MIEEKTDELTIKGCKLKVTYDWEHGDIKRYITPKPWDTHPQVNEIKKVEVLEGNILELLEESDPVELISITIEENEV